MTVTNPKTKKPVDDKGTYVTVFKKQADGNWKAIEDMSTSEVAPQVNYSGPAVIIQRNMNPNASTVSATAPAPAMRQMRSPAPVKRGVPLRRRWRIHRRRRRYARRYRWPGITPTK